MKQEEMNKVLALAFEYLGYTSEIEEDAERMHNCIEYVKLNMEN